MQSLKNFKLYRNLESKIVKTFSNSTGPITINVLFMFLLEVFVHSKVHAHTYTQFYFCRNEFIFYTLFSNLLLMFVEQNGCPLAFHFSARKILFVYKKLSKYR